MIYLRYIAIKDKKYTYIAHILHKRVRLLSKYNLDLLWSGKYFDIEYKKYNSRASMRNTHYHMHYEIYYQLSGDRYYFIKDKTYYIEEGTIVWLNVTDIHKTIVASKESGERILINFDKDFLESMASEELEQLLDCFKDKRRVLKLNLAQRKEMENLLQKMLKESKDILYSKILLSEYLLLSNRYLKKAKTKENTNVENSVKYERIASIAKYINEHYNEKITLENVAKMFYISPYYLSRTFKAGTGFNFINYLNYIRIGHAKKLLIETDMSVINISEKVGYENISHFNRVFKEIEGMTPLKYRKGFKG